MADGVVSSQDDERHIADRRKNRRRFLNKNP